jgi:hypothetical protein
LSIVLNNPGDYKGMDDPDDMDDPFARMSGGAPVLMVGLENKGDAVMTGEAPEVN